MNSVRIKICGITSLDDALACAAAGADYLGFIFHEESPRAITPIGAARIIRMLPEGVIPVGVFVNEDPDIVTRTIAVSGVRMVQLSGDEPPESAHRMPVPVIKVFRAPAAAGPTDGPRTEPDDYRLYACMVDGGAPGVYGGSGRLPDLSLARRLGAGRRLFLAGGLNHDNVCGLIAEVRPYAVDVNSGTELLPGAKDHHLVRRFCNAVRTFIPH